ncbi:MAG: 3-carboxy-cis,cis-muconate cycloisomerase [Anaerolineaceae bacterium]|nr:3-carboxy-cis,cis-muconate cycloisomerase [Anaerolineaceae bacterium]
MAFSPLDSQLFSTLFNHAEVAEQFSDAHFVQYMVDVETALAVVQGQLGIIPEGAAAQIVAGTAVFTPNSDHLRAGMEKAGVPVSELVHQLRAHVGENAADYVHWGATTQDIVDTARILQIRAVLALLEAALEDVIGNLAQLADQHRHTLMAGRTHSQQAMPITFGLKVANWLAPLLRHRQRLSEMKPRLLVVQFGGAAGTLAALGENGTAVQTALAQELNLNVPPTPWHTQRDNLAELAGWLSLVSGSLAKMAQDIILLAQSEVAEVRETADSSRGGSSTMPQKHNPIISELIIAAARTNASLLSAMHQALIQEHERGTHGWQMEWLTLPQMMGFTAAALQKARFLSQNLVVDEARMRQNVAAANGLMLAEAITFALAPNHMSRTEAKQLVKAACQVALQENRHLVDVVQAQTNAPLDWLSLRDESAYLGAANEFIDRVLAHCKTG